MSIKTIPQAEAALLPYVPLVAQLTGKDTTLQRIVPLMKLLGNPEERLRVVHIAGTSGKTSTAYFTAELLRAAGKKIGLTVSPHVDSLTERVQINGQPLSDSEFCEELDTFLALISQVKQPPSYFELLYSFALWVFDRRGVDYAVVETGMGGLHDATNIAKRPDKVCVITDIGLDHMHILGHTIPEIVAQKIGIVHQRNSVLMYQQAEGNMRVIEAWVQKMQASLQLTTEAAERAVTTIDISTALPLYQQRNWLLAKFVYDYLANRDNLSQLTSQVLLQSLEVQVPGRMDTTTIQGKTIIMDGAHNEQKVGALITSFKDRYPDSKPAVMIALKQGKEYRAVVPLLAAIASQVIVTTFKTSQDLPVQSMDPEVLADAFRQYPQCNVRCIADQQLAFQALLAAPEAVGVVTGSFYLLSQLRKNSA